MSLTQLKFELEKDKIKVLFTDYYDTLIHRTIHPNQALRIWSKTMIRELGLNISIDELYFIRQESLIYLTKKRNKNSVEIPYRALKEEVCARVINENIISIDKKEYFLNLFEEADIRSETNVQYLNNEILNLIKDFKEKGGKVYLVSDFYGSKSMFQKLLDHHNILDYFDDIFSSASLEKSKSKDSIYKDILNELSLQPDEVMMIGDNKISDYINAKKNGLNSFLLPHKHHLRRNKRKGLGSDKRKLEKVINSIYNNCNQKKSIPYTEYIVFYHVFIEKLYNKCKEQNIKTLFFLAREGMFLKKIFDSYQEYMSLDGSVNIQSHYLKISRQASLQISLKKIENEDFQYLKKKHPSLSVRDFLKFLNCQKDIINNIISDLNILADLNIENFFTSSTFNKLKSNILFQVFYENHRIESKLAFDQYVRSFKTDLDQEQIRLVDIGWGGTMQESIYNFFDEKTPVTGYYLGLKEIYNIQENTKRFGLLFSIYPYTTYNDYILKANTQLYEQFSAANHGSSIGYTTHNDNYAIEYHEPNEKWLFDNYIKDHQTEMLKHHLLLLKKLDVICYDDYHINAVITKFALKLGLYQSKRKLKFIKNLSSGFYQNIGSNKVGITYKPPGRTNYIKDFVHFLMTPEKYFRYLVKVKPLLYEKNKILAFLFPSTLLYLYFIANKFLRFKILKKIVLLKYNLIK